MTDANLNAALIPTYKGGGHCLTIKADNTTVHYFINKAQLLSLMNTLIDYTATTCERCGEWGADEYEHEGRSWLICKPCDSDQPAIGDLIKANTEWGTSLA